MGYYIFILKICLKTKKRRYLSYFVLRNSFRSKLISFNIKNYFVLVRLQQNQPNLSIGLIKLILSDLVHYVNKYISKYKLLILNKKVNILLYANLIRNILYSFCNIFFRI